MMLPFKHLALAALLPAIHITYLPPLLAQPLIHLILIPLTAPVLLLWVTVGDMGQCILFLQVQPLCIGIILLIPELSIMLGSGTKPLNENPNKEIEGNRLNGYNIHMDTT